MVVQQLLKVTVLKKAIIASKECLFMEADMLDIMFSVSCLKSPTNMSLPFAQLAVVLMALFGNTKL